MFCLTCLWNIYISCCRSCHRHRRWSIEMKFTQNPKVYKYSSSFQQVRKISLFSYYFLLALTLQARRIKCKNVQGKHTHIYLHLVFQTNHFLLLIASGISMYTQPRSTLQYWGLYNANWMRKQWLKIKLPYLCATASAHFVYCW